jgi:glycosyltransferase involved in cell wall biosynthesis
VPYLLRPLGTLAPWALEQKRWQKRTLLRLAGHRMIERAAAVHYTTEAEARLTESAIGLTRGIVVPLGLADEWLQQRAVPDGRREPVVLMLARLHPVKNLETAIAAFHALGADAAGWRLVVAGDGDPAYRRLLEAQAAAGPAGDRIVFTGWIDGPIARSWLARASLFVQPSHQESFGVAVLEAMSSGVPVVVSRGVSLAEEVERSGAGWVSGADVAGLSRVLAGAIQDEAERSRRGLAARAAAARFTWSAAAASLEAVYRQVCGAAGPSRQPAPTASRMNRAS